MKRAISISLLTTLLWFGSLFIKLAEYQSRGEIVRLYVYSLYGWLPALLREPGRVFSEVPAFIAIAFSVFICVCHVALCFAVIRAGIWFYARLHRHPTIPNECA